MIDAKVLNKDVTQCVELGVCVVDESQLPLLVNVDNFPTSIDNKTASLKGMA